MPKIKVGSATINWTDFIRSCKNRIKGLGRKIYMTNRREKREFTMILKNRW